MTRIGVIDTETTGKEDDDEIVQLGLVVLDGFEIEAVSQIYVMPERKDIPPDASAVHHITMDKLHRSDLVYSRQAAREWLEVYARGLDMIVAHNAPFDSKFLPELKERPWVCTLTCAKHLWPDAPGFGLQVLRYWLALPEDYLRGEAHSAAYDATCAAHLFNAQRKYLGRTYDPVEPHLLELTGRVPIQKMCRFGMHRGKLWKDVPKDYMNWILRKNTSEPFDAEIIVTVKHYLGLSPPEGTCGR